VSARKAKPFGENSFDPGSEVEPGRALVPAVQRVNEQRVRRGFWPKIGKVASRIPFAGEVVAAWFCVRDPDTPTHAKAILLAALAYFVSPIDAIPDALAGIGFTDDAAVIAAALAIVGAHVKAQHRAAAKATLERMRA
jgi:uncharacterized membrane protein YkvA (DUF1232 family)